MSLKKQTVGILFFLLISFPVSLLAEEELQSLENISQELVEIRQEIEALHNEISFEKDAYNDKLRSYANQKSDLDVRISRAELNNKDLQRELEKLASINQQKNQAQEVITPVLEDAIAQLRESIKDSLPFKLSQRLQALDEIEQRLNGNIISPNKAANQLWAYVEDELMLGKSSGIYNETITIDGQEKLVKVLRIGKIAMFFKTQNDNFGVIKRDSGQWRQSTIENRDNIAQLENLFDSFAKNIRNGQFTVPNFLPKS